MRKINYHYTSQDTVEVEILEKIDELLPKELSIISINPTEIKSPFIDRRTTLYHHDGGVTHTTIEQLRDIIKFLEGYSETLIAVTRSNNNSDIAITNIHKTSEANNNRWYSLLISILPDDLIRISLETRHH